MVPLGMAGRHCAFRLVRVQVASELGVWGLLRGHSYESQRFMNRCC